MGLNRGMKRATAKADYDKFATSWRKERRYQREQMAAGTLDPNTQLGRKPTFAQWMDAVRQAEARKTVTPVELQEHINDVQDLDWKDE